MKTIKQMFDIGNGNKRAGDEMEIWRSIRDFEGLYEISSFGRIKGLDRRVNYRDGLTKLIKGKILKQGTDKDGYKDITIGKEGKHYSVRIHRLVGIAFHENPENKPHINHVDGDKSNNMSSNLEWATQSENEKHAYAIGLKTGQNSMTGRLGSLSPNYKKVFQYDLKGNKVAEFNGGNEASRLTGTSISGIRNCLEGRKPQAKGFVYKYN